MGVGFASYEIVRSGMFVNERGLYVTGHNIANANTPGYVRQQAMITTSSYMNSDGGKYQLGLGADIQQIRQIRHVFLDNMYRRENTTLGYWESQNKTFQDVQAILGEPMGEGLQSTMNEFWNFWQELSTKTSNITARSMVVESGRSLVNQINHIGSQLDRLQNDINTEVQVRIDEVNQITEQIAKLNVEILKVEITKDTANDYRDQRNLLVDRLSKLVDADVNEMQDGQLDIVVGGYYLVRKGINTEIYAGETQTGGLFYVPKLKGTDIEVPLNSGVIKGLMQSRGEVLGSKGSIQNGTPNMKADIVFAVDVSDTSAGYLSNVKANIASYVNELKKRGVDYNLRLITYGDNVISNTNFGTNDIALATAIPATPNVANTGNNFGGTNGVIKALEDITDFRPNANRQAIVFTGESIDGDGGTVVTDPSIYIGRLNAIGIKTSVVTDSSYFGGGNPNVEVGWESITKNTGGKLYDINTGAIHYADLMASIGYDTNSIVNNEISKVPNSMNLVSDLKKKFNALINIVTREINYLHKSGKTLGNPPSNGEDFFTCIDPNLPLEMGNIKLNDNLINLNNVVASETGESGDNTIALKIANLRHNPMIGSIDGVLSADEYYQNIMLEVGNNGADSARIYENQQQLVQSADSGRQSIAGVSMDEEMTNMMKYQFAYNASARAMDIVDSMIETVVNRLGLVGR